MLFRSWKEENLDKFVTGQSVTLVTKPGVAGMGLNFQHCARMAFVGRSFSYESWYQAVRRCHRFGQKRPVHVHLIVAEGEDQIGRAIDAKAAGHAEMKAEMALAMRRNTAKADNARKPYNPTMDAELAQWIK